MTMTEKELATQEATCQHITLLREMMVKVNQNLNQRVRDHDQSKLHEPEFSYFVEYTHLTSEVAYGSPEYAGFLEKMAPALAHHYATNSVFKLRRHHAPACNNP